MDASSRDRSPLRNPAAANLNLTFTDDPNPTLHNSFAHTGAQSFSDPSFNATLDQSQFLSDSSFVNFNAQAQQQPGLTLDDLGNTIYDSNHLSPHSLSNTTSPGETSTFPSFEFSDPALNDIDLLQPGNNFSNESFNNMTTSLNTHSPTPPHLLPGMQRNSSSPSPHASPNIQQSPYMNRPRNASESLDPSSALLPQAGDWAYVNGARGHRRMHSDNLSEISSHSAQASPYMGTLDSFEAAHQASPLLNAQDPAFSDGLGIGNFTISDPTVHRQSYHSPAHSPHVSPNLMAQQQRLPQFTPADNFGLNTNLNGQFMQGNELDNYGQEAFPAMGHGISPSDMGQADQLSPPEISIDFAPPIKPTMNTMAPQQQDDNLALPPRTNRTRAKSDSYAGARPAPFQRGRSPSLQPSEALSPFDSSAPVSREASPARARSGSASGRGRSTSASSLRGYMLDLADPQRPSSNGGDNKRQQKHPATFQCHLCPKRFTRAYNLRSHLRTHTDERPFVCTVCDKAFARQHDRKRHEGLHSGEKKFVCRGPLKNGGQWGCSRRFARADALGRHFRSEAGRVCIKPLLEEENDERLQQLWQEQAAAQQQVGLIPPDMAAAQQQLPFFPQALLAQYPALAGFDWSQPQGAIAEEEYAGRSSFDASSGGEMYDELSENEMGIGSMGMTGNTGFAVQGNQHQLQGYSGHSMGDFTNGFEGR